MEENQSEAEKTAVKRPCGRNLFAQHTGEKQGRWATMEGGSCCMVLAATVVGFTLRRREIVGL